MVTLTGNMLTQTAEALLLLIPGDWSGPLDSLSTVGTFWNNLREI